MLLGAQTMDDLFERLKSPQMLQLAVPVGGNFWYKFFHWGRKSRGAALLKSLKRMTAVAAD